MKIQAVLSPPAEFIARQVGGFRGALENLVPLWARFKPIMSEIEEQHFASQGGGAWPPYSPNTRVRGPAMLVLTGGLKASLVDPGQAVLEESADRMVWGTENPLAQYHHPGGWIPGRPPQRILIPAQIEPVRFQQATVQWLNEVAARYFSF